MTNSEIVVRQYIRSCCDHRCVPKMLFMKSDPRFNPCVRVGVLFDAKSTILVSLNGVRWSEAKFMLNQSSKVQRATTVAWNWYPMEVCEIDVLFCYLLNVIYLQWDWWALYLCSRQASDTTVYFNHSVSNLLRCQEKPTLCGVEWKYRGYRILIQKIFDSQYYSFENYFDIEMWV